MTPTFYTPKEARSHARETVKSGKVLLAKEITELKSKQQDTVCTK